MRYLSLCSGIEAATAAWHPLDWIPVAFSEIDPFPCAVLAHHYPDVPNWGDMTRFKEWPDATIDILVGGTPCQSFSVAGLRAGLDDPRGNLALVYLAVADRYRPKWLVWENVPGVLSSDGGRAMGSILGAMAKLGYGFSYRVLDAQYVRVDGFGRAVPQRRRRVFVVGCLGDWRPAAAVLFERESLSGNPAPRREAGEVAPTVPARSTAGGGLGTDFDCDGGTIAHSLKAEGFDASEDGTGRGTPLVPTVAPTMDKRAGRSGETTFATSGGLVPTVSPALKARDYKGPSSDGDGAPILPVAFDARQSDVLMYGDKTGPLDTDGCSQAVAFDTAQITSKMNRSNPRPGDPCHTLHQGNTHHVAFAQNQRDEVRTMDAAGALAAEPGMKQQTYIAQEKRDADAYEADASSILSTLRESVGEETYQQWGIGILAAFQSEEVLRAWLHGGSLCKQTEKIRSGLDDSALSRSPNIAERLLRQVWKHGPDGRTSQGRGLAKQLAGEPGEALSVLPHERAPRGKDMLYLREAAQGARLLRQALSEVQEVRRSDDDEAQPAHPRYQVRRLTPKEAERLMGFSDDYTLIEYRGKPAKDGPRYKALGNSMAVNVMRWIGARIQMFEEAR